MISFDVAFWNAGTVNVPEQRGRSNPQGIEFFSRQTLPSDPIGLATVTFSGVQANSEIRIFLDDGSELVGIENCTENQVLTWDVYSNGSPNNNITIRIINSQYKIKEFSYVSMIGNQTIPIQQEKDKWYFNPI
jgi:hypothetical protein